MLFDGKKFYYAVVDDETIWVRAFPTKDTRDEWVDLAPNRLASSAAQVGPERVKIAKKAISSLISEQYTCLELAHSYADKFDYKEAFHKTAKEYHANDLIEKIEANGIILTDEQRSNILNVDV